MFLNLDLLWTISEYMYPLYFIDNNSKYYYIYLFFPWFKKEKWVSNYDLLIS